MNLPHCRHLLLILALAAAMSAAPQEPPAVFAPLKPAVLKQFKADALALLSKTPNQFGSAPGKKPWVFYEVELQLNARTVEDYLKAVPGIVDLQVYEGERV